MVSRSNAGNEITRVIIEKWEDSKAKGKPISGSLLHDE